MGAWLLKAFSGEQPRISANLLPPNASQQAVNVRLDDGAIDPLRRPLHVTQFAGYPGNYQSIHRYLTKWLGWPGAVYAVQGPVATDRLYIMGDGAPKMRVGDTVYPLAVPFPTAPLTGAVTGTPSGSSSTSVVSRVYVYTFVTGFGEESEPCPASDVIHWQDGQTVTLSGFQGDPGGRNIVSQRIYRTQTGDAGTDLYFIAERPVSNANFVDNIADDAFAEVLPSRAYNPPPDTLTGLINMPNGMMAAFSGKDLYFCYPWMPHAWPQAYVLTCESDIVALGAVGNSLIIMTTGRPYFAQGTDPSSMQMVRLPSDLPCINPLGVVDLGRAIAYPSHEGLVLATGDGMAELVTAQLFNREEWQRFNPATICAGQLSGRYIASYNSVNPDGTPLVGTFIIHTDGSGAFLSRSDVRAAAFYYDISEGALYYLTTSGEVLQFDAPNGAPLDYYWKSRPLLLSAPDNFAVIRVDSDDAPNLQDIANTNAAIAAARAANATLIASPLGSELNGVVLNAYPLGGDPLEQIPASAKSVTVGIYADGVLRATATKTGQMLRLPAGFKARKWEVDVYGSARVQQIAMATSVTELKAMAGG